VYWAIQEGPGMYGLCSLVESVQLKPNKTSRFGSAPTSLASHAGSQTPPIPNHNAAAAAPSRPDARPFRGAYPGSALPHRLVPLTPLRDKDSSRLLRFHSVSMPRVRLSFVRIVSTVVRSMIIVRDCGYGERLFGFVALFYSMGLI
jgi:hypothetical protein